MNAVKYYLITDGPLLSAVKTSIKMKRELLESAHAFKDERGAKSFFLSHVEPAVKGLLFDKGVKLPADWKKPDERNFSEPYKKSEEMRLMNSLPKGQNDRDVIYEITGIPQEFEYKKGKPESRAYDWGYARAGIPLNEHGFLYLSDDGPYCLWITDLKKVIQDEYLDRGYSVSENVLKWEMNVEGITEISQEKWESIAGAHKSENSTFH